MSRFIKILYRDLWSQFYFLIILAPFLGVWFWEKDSLPLNAAFIISFIILLFTAKPLYKRFRTAIYLSKNGVEVKAIVKSEMLSFRGSSDIYYEFIYKGRKYRSFGNYSRISPGTEIKILIDPENPEIQIII